MDEPNGYLIDATKHLGLEGSRLELDDVNFRGAHNGPNAIRVFSKHIRERYDELSKAEGVMLSPYARESGYLRRAVYTFTRFVEDEKGLGALKRHVDGVAHGPSNPRGPSVEENPFHWMLTAVFPDHELKRTKLDMGPMFPQQRNHIARQLLYADRHGVPAEYLIGFLYQSGKPNEIARKLKEKSYESWVDSAKLSGTKKRRKKRGNA